MKSGTGVVFLPCSDIRETERFYHGILGFPVVERQSEDLLVFDTGYGYWGFCRYADGRAPLSGPGGVCLSVNLESEEAVSAAFEKIRGLTYINCYSNNSETLDALTEKLMGRDTFRGRSPVDPFCGKDYLRY